MQMRNEMKQTLMALAAIAALSVGTGWVCAASDNAPAVTIPPGNAAPTTQPTAGTTTGPTTTAPTTAPSGTSSSGTNSSGTAGSGSGTAGPSSGTAGSGASNSGEGGSATAPRHHSHAPSRKHGGSEKSGSLSSFIGEISGTHVNIRSGAGLRYYIVGQLTQGELVNVVKTTHGWDAISAPAGARCYVAKQYVKLNSTGDRGTITSRFVNLRAASALTPASDYAVVGLARRGQRVSVVGRSGMFYIIRAPMHTHFYVYASFVEPAPVGSTYISPQLQMPPDFKGVSVAGLAPASMQGATNPASVPVGNAPAQAGSNAPSAVGVAGGAPTTAGAPATSVTPAPLVPANIKPAPTYNPNAYRQFSKLDKALLVQFKKPLLKRKLKKLDAGFKALLKRKNLPGSIRSAARLRLKEINRMIAIQQLAAAPVASQPIQSTLAPYQQQWEQSKKILEKSIATAPFIARGLLETSHTTHQYALLDPYNGRVVAYVEPPKDMDLSKLIGSYVGIKGLVVSKTGAFIRVIQPDSATLLPNPKP